MLRERLAAVWAVTLLCNYLNNSHFTTRADYEAVWKVLTRAEATGELKHWRIRLSEFDIVHCDGIKHQ